MIDLSKYGQCWREFNRRCHVIHTMWWVVITILMTDKSREGETRHRPMTWTRRHRWCTLFLRAPLFHLVLLEVSCLRICTSMHHLIWRNTNQMMSKPCMQDVMPIQSHGNDVNKGKNSTHYFAKNILCSSLPAMVHLCEPKCPNNSHLQPLYGFSTTF